MRNVVVFSEILLETALKRHFFSAGLPPRTPVSYSLLFSQFTIFLLHLFRSGVDGNLPSLPLGLLDELVADAQGSGVGGTGGAGVQLQLLQELREKVQDEMRR